MTSDAKVAPLHSLWPPRHTALRYVDLAATRHLTTGLAFDLTQCVPVLDHALAALNEQTGIPDQLISWIQAGALAAGPCPYNGRGRIIIDVSADSRGGVPQLAGDPNPRRQGEVLGVGSDATT